MRIADSFPNRFPPHAHRRWRRKMLAAILCGFLAAVLSQTSFAQATDPEIPDYSRNPEWFPRIYKPYVRQPIPGPDLKNSVDLTRMTREGTMKLSLAQLLVAVVENNLDIAVARYNNFMVGTDLLRARAGQAPRGSSGVPVPSGLFAGAIGAGLGGGGRGGGGGGGGGGVSGSSRLVSVGPRGSFDPSLNLSFSVDAVTSPLNTIQVSGIPSVIGHTSALQINYAQAFTTGTSFSLSLNMVRDSSTQQFLLFNPSLTSRFNLSVNQQLLSGFGFAVTRRLLRVAENNRTISKDVLRQQAILAINNAQNLYWDLVSSREQVRAAEQALEVAQRLYENNKKQAEIGTLAPLDVVSADAEVAARRRDRIAAQTNQQIKEVQLQNVMSKEMDPRLGEVRIDAMDPLPDPHDSDIPRFEDALVTAMRNRPEITQAEGGILNQEIVTQFTRKQLLPSLSLFGQLGSSARAGALGGALAQVRGLDFPEYAFGFALTIPILNRSAQADAVRAQLEMRQIETSFQRTRNQIRLDVRNAIIGLMQAKARVESARKALDLRKQFLDAEEKKLQAGVATPYSVIQVQRDFIAAEVAEVQARANYAKALVAMDQATGVTLEKNNIQLEQLIAGRASSR